MECYLPNHACGLALAANRSPWQWPVPECVGVSLPLAWRPVPCGDYIVSHDETVQHVISVVVCSGSATVQAEMPHSPRG